VTTETKTKELIRPMPLDWWLKKRAYALFMLRDISSVFIAGYCIFLLYVLCRSREAERFDVWYQSWGSPWSRILHLAALGFAVFHSVTFFNLTPRVLVVFRGEEKLPDSAIAVGHYVLWAVVSLVIIIIGMAV
jgi:fumarate reductase subunit C